LLRVTFSCPFLYRAGSAPAARCRHGDIARQETVDDSQAALEILGRSSYVPDLAPLALDPDFPAKRA
jgi:hypothetical protein